MRKRMAMVGAAGSAVLALGVAGAGPAAAASSFDQSGTEVVTLQNSAGGTFTCSLYWDHFGYADGTGYARAIVQSGDASCSSRNSQLRVTSVWVDGDGDTRQTSSAAYGTWALTQSMEDIEGRLRTDYVFHFEACQCSVSRALVKAK